MKRLLIIFGVLVLVIVGIVVLKNIPATSEIIWKLSNSGAWIFPLVLIAAILDSVHPCSFAILLLTIAFLFGMQLTRAKILQIGGVYITGIFASYLLIGLGILKVLHLFNTPHFMGKLGATILIVFGIINIVNEFFPRFPIKLKIPSMSHTAMGRLMEQASIPAAFGLGVLVGVCQFPCMGGPYLMVIGLLRDQATYAAGLGYLILYNLILIVPLVVVLFFAANEKIVDKMQEWKTMNVAWVRFWAGLIMIALGIIVLFL